VPGHYKVDFRHVTFLLEDVAVVGVIQEFSRHEAKSDFICKVRVEFFSRPEKALKRRLLKNVLKQELAHDVVLYIERYAIKVLFLFKERSHPVILPKVSEV